MAEQTVLFTVIPRTRPAAGDTLPVSVVVSPRLRDGARLGEFPDWLLWTSKLQQEGLGLVFRCAGATFRADIDTAVLRPDLWEQLFNEETPVHSHQFNDYSEREILSFPMRDALSVVKSIYQKGAVELALPTPTFDFRDKQVNPNREKLAGLIQGLEVNWSDRNARELRAMTRARAQARTDRSALSLDREGLVPGDKSAGQLRAAAQTFAAFNHMPTPPQGSPPIDLDQVLDFHRAISSLDSYTELRRALGLVFDLELPVQFVKETPFTAPGTLSIAELVLGWQLPVRIPELETSYIHFVADGLRIFLTPPRTFIEPSMFSGLLTLDPRRFGLAQVDVDGAMHKAIILAETWHSNDPGRNRDANAKPGEAPHPEVFDPEATLPALRSGGFSIFADERAAALFDTIKQSKVFNQALDGGGPKPPPFVAEDLVLGYRIDVWDSRSEKWHSLHLRRGEYRVGELLFSTAEEEGFVQLAATQPAKGANPPDPDLYLHEAIARWAGWSLSAPRPGKHLSRFADPADAVPRDGDDRFRENEPDTPFKLAAIFRVLPGTLPRLRFGVRYRVRVRVVDLAGNSLPLGDAFGDAFSRVAALPRQPEGLPYLRYEPVIAPIVVARDASAFTYAGSALDRLVIRTANADVTQDIAAAGETADRHILPPRTSVEMGERLGMFDDAAGNLKGDAATWAMIRDRDAAQFQQQEIEVAGKTNFHPIEPADRIDTLPYLPDPLARGAAIRDLPGTRSGTIAKVEPGAGAAGAIAYAPLIDPNPRPGSATLIRFGQGGDWEQTSGFRLVLTEPAAEQAELQPAWDPSERVLTVFLSKGETKVVPVSCYLLPDDLKLMGVWRWLTDYVEALAAHDAAYLEPDAPDRIGQVLQRANEGGHWMLTPPLLLTLVHAVQQPIGRPAFTALDVEHAPPSSVPDVLQTAPVLARTDPTELALITAWRKPGATDALLMGALKIHGASTAKIEITAEWDDPVDDPDDPTKPATATVHRQSPVDEIPISSLGENYLIARGAERRRVGYYDPEHEQIGFTREGDLLAEKQEQQRYLATAAPRHEIGDTKRHRIRYTAIATSRYQEYFPPDAAGGFTRSSEPVMVDVPASARPLAPSVVYVVPTFGWQRQTETNVKRSVRLGGGLRVYLRRPWFSSGEGELFGIALWSQDNGVLDETSRRAFQPLITQWGNDPIWQTAPVSRIPDINDFPGAVTEQGVTLAEPSPSSATGEPAHIDVAAFPVEFDESRGLWFADVTIDPSSHTYMPFVRLAVVRYQPHALADAKVSQVVLADFAQITPDRAALVTFDPYRPRTLRVVVSGIAPRGPKPVVRRRGRNLPVKPFPTQVFVRVQRRDPGMQTDLGWSDIGDAAKVDVISDTRVAAQPDLELWTGTVTFTDSPPSGEYRLLIEEYEYVSADYAVTAGRETRQPGRLIYAETIAIEPGFLRA